LTLQAGQILADKYRIVKPIGVGGMGTVYEGENVRIHRRVAIKTLHVEVAGKSDVLARFEREAQAAGRIGSDHIVEVLDMGDLPDGSRYMVMEFLDGTTLGDRIVNSGRIAPRDVVAPLTQLLDGLGAAHNAGIIHRDLKPANVFLLTSRGGRPDFVKILDFGVSKFNILNSDEMSMTRTGAVMGTPYYMSPEQAKGARAIDMRSDLYSVGVILYESITGQVPFNAETFNELIFKIALEAPPPPEHFVPNLDPAFGVLVRKAMGRDPNERFQSAAEMKEALLAWARDYDQRVAMGNQATARTQMLPMVHAGMPQGPQPQRPASTLLGQVEAAAQARISNQHGYPVQEAYAPPPQKSNAIVFIALGMALVVGAAAAVFFLYGPAEARQSTSSSKPAAGETATATETASEPSEASAQPVSSQSAAPTSSVELLTSDSATSSSTPSASAPQTGTATAPVTVAKTGPRPTGTLPPTLPTATATSKATGTTKGRDIRPDL
jgi:eukaryotic-like serine/threonine-protein kinase